jgi:S-adenosylmethionine synthetase
MATPGAYRVLTNVPSQLPVEHVIKSVIPADMLDTETTYYINLTGRFVIGGRRPT